MSDLADRVRTKRQILSAPGGSHDRLIRALRVILPSIIGILLAVLAFSPFSGTQELSFVLAKNEVNMAKERMRLTEALYRGEDSKGRPRATAADDRFVGADIDAGRSGFISCWIRTV
jgi:lipopolysaccharide export system protein LptC